MGGLACRLYGTTRIPNDIDVLCLTDAWEQETLKQKLTEVNRKFYLVPSRDPSATYKVLWYKIHVYPLGTIRVKVDLLFRGVLDIPDIPLSKIDRTNDSSLPCMPLSPLLILKLQGWIHHGDAIESRYRMKQPADVQDINDLLEIARQRNIRPRSESYLPQSFITRAETRVMKYVKSQPSSRDHWISIGFDLPFPINQEGLATLTERLSRLGYNF